MRLLCMNRSLATLALLLALHFHSRAENRPAPFEPFGKEFSTRPRSQWSVHAGRSEKDPQSPVDLSVSPAPSAYRAKAMLSFRIEPEPADPYPPDGEGDVRIVLPDGNEVLAFFDQDYATVADGSAQRDVAV